MKYIKEYKIFESSDVLYYALDHQEFNGLVSYIDDEDVIQYKPELQSLSEDEIKYLESIGGKVENIDGVPYNRFKIDKIKRGVTFNIKLFIFKMPDEWYYVTDPMNSVCYKCDTFEGLKQLIDRLIESRGFAMRIVESNDDSLYHEVSDIDWNNMVIKDGINYNDFHKVVSSINDLNIKGIEMDLSKWENSYDKYNVHKIDCLSIKIPIMVAEFPNDKRKLSYYKVSYYKEIVIYQLVDEYFALTILNLPGNKYYKCDTLDGLIQILKMIKEQSEAS